MRLGFLRGTVIGPLAADSDPQPELIVYKKPDWHLNGDARIAYSQRQHYFDRFGVNIGFSKDPHQLKLMAQSSAIHSPRMWILYQRSGAIPTEIEAIESGMANLDYTLCDSFGVGADTTILDFFWNTLDCNRIIPVIEVESQLIEYEFFDTHLVEDGSMLYFVNSWRTVSDFTSDNYMFSYQLVTSDWANVAQLDVPLVYEAMPQRFSIDVSDVPAGDFRLMAIMYNRHTGERVPWKANLGYVPEMLTLKHISL